MKQQQKKKLFLFPLKTWCGLNWGIWLVFGNTRSRSLRLKDSACLWLISLNCISWFIFTIDPAAGLQMTEWKSPLGLSTPRTADVTREAGYTSPESDLVQERDQGRTSRTQSCDICCVLSLVRTSLTSNTAMWWGRRGAESFVSRFALWPVTPRRKSSASYVTHTHKESERENQ